MGTFLGHLLPGSFFLLFAIWWFFSVLNRYYKAKYRRGPVYRSTCTFACCCCCGRVPLEGLTKVVCCCAGVAAELVTAYEDNKFTFFGNGQHATMYACFGLSGLVDVAVHCKAPLPAGADYAACLLSFAAEGLLFTFHLHGRTKVDAMVHTMLVYAIWCCVLSLLVELRSPRSVLPALARCFFTALQGSWFVQVGAMLYPPLPWLSHRFLLTSGDEHDSIMLATVMFAWHGVAIATFAFCLALLVARYHARHSPPDGSERREVSMERLIKADGDRSDDEDSES